MKSGAAVHTSKNGQEDGTMGKRRERKAQRERQEQARQELEALGPEGAKPWAADRHLKPSRLLTPRG